MSCSCTGVIRGVTLIEAEALLTELRTLLAGSPIHIFCPPLYEEPFLKALPDGGRLVLSFADDPVYDNCERLFRANAAENMRLLAEAAALILHRGCQFELFIASDSGAPLEDYDTLPITPTDLQQRLTETCLAREFRLCNRFILHES